MPATSGLGGRKPKRSPHTPRARTLPATVPRIPKPTGCPNTALAPQASPGRLRRKSEGRSEASEAGGCAPESGLGPPRGPCRVGAASSRAGRCGRRAGSGLEASAPARSHGAQTAGPGLRGALKDSEVEGRRAGSGVRGPIRARPPGVRPGGSGLTAATASRSEWETRSCAVRARRRGGDARTDEAAQVGAGRPGAAAGQ